MVDQRTEHLGEEGRPPSSASKCHHSLSPLLVDGLGLSFCAHSLVRFTLFFIFFFHSFALFVFFILCLPALASIHFPEKRRNTTTMHAREVEERGGATSKT